MLKRTIITVLLTLSSFSALAEESVIRMASQHSVSETADKFIATVEEKGFNVFSCVNHQGNAEKAGLELRPTEVIVFGNPQVGTQLMHCAQEVAIDLPQKVLIYRDESGKTWLVYNNPYYLKQRHNMVGCDEVLEKVAAALENLASFAVK